MGGAVSQPSTSSAPHGYVVVTGGGQVSTAGGEMLQQAPRMQVGDFFLESMDSNIGVRDREQRVFRVV